MNSNVSIWITVLASAGVAAFISQLFTLLAQWLERKARKKDQVFNRALELAKIRTDMIMHIAEKTGKSATLTDHAFLAEEYYRWLMHLYDHGKLPDDVRKLNEAQNKEYDDT